MEDGKTIPPRAPREEARAPREEDRAPRVEDRAPREEDRRSSSDNQDFGTPNLRVPPPGYTMDNYPCLGQVRRSSMFQPRMEATARQ